MRLIALDVDGTLLTSRGGVGARTRAALQHAESAGIHVAIVTGRPLTFAVPVRDDLGLGEYVVASNGGTISHLPSGDIVYQASLPGSLVAEAIRRARAAIPGLGCAVTTPGAFRREAGLGDVAPLSEFEGVRVEDATPHDDESVQATLLFHAGWDARALLHVVTPLAPNGVAVTPSGMPGTIELTAPGTHKGSGLRRLATLLGIPQADVVAFGDGLNDVEMLTWAGLGVAMANADPEAKEAADEITASNDDDGVALVVERLLGS